MLTYLSYETIKSEASQRTGAKLFTPQQELLQDTKTVDRAIAINVSSVFI
tara:strand:- start:67 stop:216 length:150 start_codon:yes stop_codon:yes gene_type:complete